VEKLLAELSNAPAPSGFEGPIRKIMMREFRALGVEVSTDGLGSVIAVLPGPADGPRIMLDAHMDEVGAVVKYIASDGMIKFQPLGGFLDQGLVNERWTILTSKGPITAVSGLRSIHLTPVAERTKVIPRDEVFLDVGAKSKAEVEALGIRAGDAIAPISAFTELAGGRYLGKAFDDRVGCVMLIEILRRLKEQSVRTPNTIYFVAAVQEEIGLRGTHTAMQVAKPDLGISLEAGTPADYPGGHMDAAQEKVGGGPALFLADTGLLINLHLRDFLQRVAQENGISLQTELITAGADDAAELQRYDTGRPAANVAVPVRYLHTHNGVMDRSDLDRTIDLMVKVLPKLDARTVREIARFDGD
jgi:endoglucanase